MRRRTLLAVASGLLCGFAGSGLAAESPKVIATGEWSKPVADARGYTLRGRLVVYEKRVDPERREVAVYVELQDANDFIGGAMRLFCDFGRTDFRPEYRGGLRCELRDRNQRPVPSTPAAFGGAIPKSEWIKLPTDGTVRLRASPFGIHRPKARAISPQLDQLWVIEDGDASEYFLSGTFTIDPPAATRDPGPGGDEHIWRGTLVLPAARISNSGI